MTVPEALCELLLLQAHDFHDVGQSPSSTEFAGSCFRKCAFQRKEACSTIRTKRLTLRHDLVISSEMPDLNKQRYQG